MEAPLLPDVGTVAAFLAAPPCDMLNFKLAFDIEPTQPPNVRVRIHLEGEELRIQVGCWATSDTERNMKGGNKRAVIPTARTSFRGSLWGYQFPQLVKSGQGQREACVPAVHSASHVCPQHPRYLTPL